MRWLHVRGLFARHGFDFLAPDLAEVFRSSFDGVERVRVAVGRRGRGGRGRGATLAGAALLAAAVALSRGGFFLGAQFACFAEFGMAFGSAGDA